VDPAKISLWKTQLLESAGSVFESKRPTKSGVFDIDELYKQIGKVEIERGF